MTMMKMIVSRKRDDDDDCLEWTTTLVNIWGERGGRLACTTLLFPNAPMLYDGKLCLFTVDIRRQRYWRIIIICMGAQEEKRQAGMYNAS